MQFISRFKSSTPAPCHLVGIASHFSMLSAFTWMNVLAWDLARHFGTASFVPRRDNTKKKLAIYSAVGWGIPLMVVISCVIVEQVDSSLLRYDDLGDQTCWLTPVKANVLAFLVPVALSLSVNILFFSVTFYGFRKSRQDSKILRDDDIHTEVKELFGELLVHIKVYKT